MRINKYFFILLTLLAVSFTANALTFSNYYSPLNNKMKYRQSTKYIVLHTTEGPKVGALGKVYKRGEIHYLVDKKGLAYRIIHRNRIALHAGTSMWDGRVKINKYSIGIEVEGYHNGNITLKQYKALRELLSELQAQYNIPDINVLTHSMVAYGKPNRWHKKSHRGRKRCGMLFALRPVREKIGLTNQPGFDPDVKRHRLIEADKYLASVLYGNAKKQQLEFLKIKDRHINTITKGISAWDIARGKYNDSRTLYTFPNGQYFYGNEIKNWTGLPPGTKIEFYKTRITNEIDSFKILGVHGNTASEIAGNEYNSKTTIYLSPYGKIKYGHKLKNTDFMNMAKNTIVLIGYNYGGKITEKNRAFDICSINWNAPSTFYHFPDGKLISGNKVKENSIPENSLVFLRS